MTPGKAIVCPRALEFLAPPPVSGRVDSTIPSKPQAIALLNLYESAPHGPVVG